MRLISLLPLLLIAACDGGKAPVESLPPTSADDSDTPSPDDTGTDDTTTDDTATDDTTTDDTATDDTGTDDTGAGPRDADADGYAADTDCDDADPAVHPGATELCNAEDDDCDGAVDEDASDVLTFYADNDGDGHGDDTSMLSACEAPAGYAPAGGDCDDTDPSWHPGAPELVCADPNDYNCDGSVGYADNDSDGVAACEECDDADATVNPAATEVCNDRDDDCDGLSDDTDDSLDTSSATSWYADADADGSGDADAPSLACDAPLGTVADLNDCDDAEPASFPGNPELCDGIDNDCSGTIDEGVTTRVYADVDSDGWGDASLVAEVCEVAEGWVLDPSDCDDLDGAVHPGADEVCGGGDEDCDGLIDDADDSLSGAPVWYVDNDGDGVGDPAAAIVACEAPVGTAAEGTDCDDAEPTVFPGGVELCDGLDNDCSGGVDDGAADVAEWYADLDGDGFGDATAPISACTAPPGHVVDATDCDDGLDAVNPAAEEVCDGLDNNCDGTIDVDAADSTTFYADADGDSFGDPGVAVTACAAPVGSVSDNRDCDDAEPAAFPGNPETCDGIDNDCDGFTDDSVTLTVYADTDADGFGDPGTASSVCAIAGGQVTIAGDCDDGEPGVNPDATEVCNGIDDDCEGTVDADAADALPWYADTDSDGFGAPSGGILACAAPADHVSDNSDCDDTDAASYPEAPERCNGVDDDCDGVDDTLGYWPFDDGVGTVVSDSGPLGLDGTLVGASWTASGHLNGALEFDGANSHVLLDYDELAPEDGITLSAWVRPDSLEGSSWDTVLSRGAAASTPMSCCRDSYWLGYYLREGTFYVDTPTYNDPLRDGTSHLAHIGGWHHLVATWDAATRARTIWVDGVLTASDSNGPSVPYYDGSPTRIGADTNSGTIPTSITFDGLIDEVKIYNCAIDRSQVAADFAGSWPF